MNHPTSFTIFLRPIHWLFLLSLAGCALGGGLQIDGETTAGDSSGTRDSPADEDLGGDSAPWSSIARTEAGFKPVEFTPGNGTGFFTLSWSPSAIDSEINYTVILWPTDTTKSHIELATTNQTSATVRMGLQNYLLPEGQASASFIVKACGVDSPSRCRTTEISITPSSEELTSSIGYLKASNTGYYDQFGYSVALSADGSTLAVGSYGEDFNDDESADESGAVYIFRRSGTGWIQQALLKAANAGDNDRFGASVSLSSDGNTLAVGAVFERSDANGINGDGEDNSASSAGAVYIFSYSGTSWAQQAYIKASQSQASDRFGTSVALSSDGNTLAVGADREDSNTSGNELNEDAPDSGAVYVFTRSGSLWSQQAFIKASNPGAWDYFGLSISLSSDGNTLAVGASGEDSNDDGNADGSGAVYVFTRSGGTWAQQAYLKGSGIGEFDSFGSSISLSSDGNLLAAGASGDEAVYTFVRSGTTWTEQSIIRASNAGNDSFGSSVSLSGDGTTLAVGAPQEASNATGSGGDQDNDSSPFSGAVYVFSRSTDTWTQQAYLKASNTGNLDRFGRSVSLASDGRTLAVGADEEGSSATGVGGPQTDDISTEKSGAVYIY